MSSSFSGKTYSRRSPAKRRPSLGNDHRDEPGVPTLQPRKRRKVSVEIVDAPDRTLHSSSSYPKGAKMSPSPPDTTCSQRKQSRPMGDLSGTFESITPASSASSTPTKLSKRMLARSKTESSIESQISVTQADRTPSLPNFPSSPLKFIPDSPPIRAPLLTTTRTYAGKSRSFLVAIPSSLSAPNGILPDEEDDYSTRESYSTLRTRYGVDNSEDDPYPAPVLASPSRSSATSTPTGSPRKGKGKAVQDAQQMMQIPNGMMNPLKSITELRSKGESRRFLDEVGYLFEGMEATGGVGLRRASALEITTKLCDPEFARRAKAADFLSRTWDVFIEAGAGRSEDKVLDTLLTFFAALIARDPADLADLAQRTSQPPPPSSPEKGGQKQKETEISTWSFVDTLFSLLETYSSGDPLALGSPSFTDRSAQDMELKRMSVQRKDRTLFQTIHNTIISKSSLFAPDTPISTSFLILHTLQTLPPSLIPTHHLPKLLTSLRTILSPLSPSLSHPSSWPAATANMHFENVYYHLHMLDLYLLGQWDTTSTSATNESGQTDDHEAHKPDDPLTIAMNSARSWLANALIALGICVEIQSGVSGQSITEITLRVLVSLTHWDAAWARAVVDSQCASALAWVVRVILQFEWGLAKQEGEGIKKEVEAEVVKGKKDDLEVETQALDRLCLALGLLTNLVQVVEETKDLLREMRLHPSCALKNRSCIRRCTCISPTTSSHSRKVSRDTSLSALDVLTRLYIHQLPPATSTSPIHIKKESEPSPPPGTGTVLGRERDAADASFLRGHLAVLFGLLMQGNHANQEYILYALGDASLDMSADDRSKSGLERLVEQAREFAVFYTVISASGVGGHVVHDGGMEGETETEAMRESKVARDVVLFLESLRDV